MCTDRIDSLLSGIHQVRISSGIWSEQARLQVPGRGKLSHPILNGAASRVLVLWPNAPKKAADPLRCNGSAASYTYSHSLQSTFPGFLFPLGYGGLKRVLACKFVFFSVFPQFSKLWVSNWYHSLVSFRLKNRLGKSDYSFQKSDTWTRIH